MDLDRLERRVEELAFLEKLADEPGLFDLAESVAVPTALGVGGYALSRNIGSEGLGSKIGVPDWLLGPAVGIGLGLPIYRGVRRLVTRPSSEESERRRMEEYQQALEAEMQAQAQLEAQAREMMQSAMLGQEMPANEPYMTRMASLRKRAADAEGYEGEGGGGASGAAQDALERARDEDMDWGDEESTYSEVAPLVLAKKLKRAAASLAIPMDQVDTRYQQIQQQAKAQQEQAAAQTVQQAAIAQLVKRQFQGLGKPPKQQR